ncbi:MAG: peptidylprolyl isomerase [Deltaproteobacteria bacterium]|nr:peptidylprolyl isomerase [Deltaproteobacteria bacterium]
MVLIETSLGDIKIELYPEKAPVTVDNFLAYVKEGFFDGLVFHRVIKDFVIQAGGFLPDMKPRRPTRPPIKNEADTELLNQRGTIAMARTMEVNSATSQFYINVADNKNLDHVDKTSTGYGYAVFGKVIDGMDVVDKIQAVSTHQVKMFRDVPREPVVIEKTRLLNE